MAWFTKCPKTIEIRFLGFFICLSLDCETGGATASRYWQSKFGKRASYWYQFHFPWLFPDFLLNFKISRAIWKCTDFSWLFKIFTFSWFFLTCGNPEWVPWTPKQWNLYTPSPCTEANHLTDRVILMTSQCWWRHNLPGCLAKQSVHHADSGTSSASPRDLVPRRWISWRTWRSLEAPRHHGRNIGTEIWKLSNLISMG